MKLDNESNFASFLNALGTMLVKRYKYIDIFKEEKEDKKVTQLEKESLFRDLENL